MPNVCVCMYVCTIVSMETDHSKMFFFPSNFFNSIIFFACLAFNDTAR